MFGCRHRAIAALVAFGALMGAGCTPPERAASRAAGANPTDPCRLALAPRDGTEEIDRDIARLQDLARTSDDPLPLLELGQRLIAKARRTHDAGSYRQAEQCALCVDARHPGHAQALLLRGLVLHQRHDFRGAEAIARQLVARRGLFLDYGLLGDALLERGELGEAAGAYQRMMDLRPGFQAYTRAAHLRWLQGDLEGALTLARMALGAASPRDRESTAWAHTRLAALAFQAGRSSEADESVRAALAFVPDYAPALLVHGRALVAAGDTAAGIDALRRSAAAHPATETRWALADALRLAGRTAEALTVEADLRRGGAAEDPRALALYLATRGEELDRALALAERELAARADVFTLDALAWALAAAGRLEEADGKMAAALAAGTTDARLFYHAGSIAAARGDRERARAHFDRAASISQVLLPSERRHMDRQRARL